MMTENETHRLRHTHRHTHTHTQRERERERGEREREHLPLVDGSVGAGGDEFEVVVGPDEGAHAVVVALEVDEQLVRHRRVDVDHVALHRRELVSGVTEAALTHVFARWRQHTTLHTCLFPLPVCINICVLLFVWAASLMSVCFSGSLLSASIHCNKLQYFYCSENKF